MRRNSPRDIKIRGLDVMVNGQFVQDLSFGKAFALDLPAGKHEVMATNRLYKRKLEIGVNPGETVIVDVGNVVGGLGALMVLAIGMGFYGVFIELAADGQPTVTE